MGLRPRRLAHIALIVHSLDEMIAFYCDVLDMRLSDRMPYPEDSEWIEAAWLRCAEETDHHSMSLFERRHPPERDVRERAQFGLHHYAYEMASFSDLQQAARGVRERGLPLVGMRWGGPGAQVRLYFNDPEANVVELYWGLDKVGFDGRTRSPYPEIEDVDIETLDVDEFLRWKEALPT